MTGSLPEEIQQVFERFLTTECTTVDERGQPIVWPLTPFYEPGQDCIDVCTGLGYPKKAKDAAANPKVSLLFSDPTGSGLSKAPQVLVQGIADVDDRNLEANRERYVREQAIKLPATVRMLPPKPIRGIFNWYFTRIYIHVRPERIYVWPGGDASAEPQLFDSHMEEVRSGHAEEPPGPHAEAEGGATSWDERLNELGERYPEAVLSIVAPDGFPFSARLPISLDRERRLIRLGAGAQGLPMQPGLACLTAHDHAPDFTWQRNFQVRGDLVEDGGEWVLVPHKLVGGFELPPGSTIQKYRQNASKMRRYHRHAKRELAARGR